MVAAALLVRRCDGRSPAFATTSDGWGYVRCDRCSWDVVLVGYVVALVPARRCHLDIGSFRRALWVGLREP